VPFVIYTAHGFVHNNETWQETAFNKAAARLTDQVIAVSGQLGEVLAARGLSGRRMRVVTNGIDTEQFQPGQTLGTLRRRLGLGPDDLIVGSVARLEPIKNQAMLIDAIAQAWSQGVDCHGVLIGEGSLGIALAAQAERLGIARRIHFWGQESNVAPLYRELDLFALTSDAEGTSISLLEAMASGICPIATAVGGTPAVIGANSEPAGVLTAPRRSEQFAASIVELALNPERRRQMGSAARRRAVEHFSDEVMIEAYERLYAEGVTLGTGARG
jgi:glycosyltransferase involved in cell wall biosynthesis